MPGPPGSRAAEYAVNLPAAPAGERIGKAFFRECQEKDPAFFVECLTKNMGSFLLSGKAVRPRTRQKNVGSARPGGVT
jgi:hypothetical protein